MLATDISHNSFTKYSFSCLAAVQSWYNGSTTGQNNNYGIMMCYSKYWIDDYNAFYSADYTNEAKRPAIVIYYQDTTIDIDVGYSYTLAAPSATGTVTWASSDTSVVTVNSSGKFTGVKIGFATVTASVGGVVLRTYNIYVTLADGVYYLGSSTGLYLAMEGSLSAGTPVKMLSKQTQGAAKLRQLWKIEYVEGGYYYIRSLYLATRALQVTSNTANITSISTSTNPYTASLDCRWIIETNSSGYIFKHRQSSTSTSSQCLRPSGTDVVTSHYVSGNSLFTWDLDPVTGIANQVLLLDIQTGNSVAGGTYYIDPGKKITPSELGMVTSVVCAYSLDQDIDWYSMSTSSVSIDENTDEMIQLELGGSSIISAKHRINGVEYSARFTVYFKATPNGDYYIRSRAYDKYMQVDSNDASNNFSTSGANIEQWAYHGSDYQKWSITWRGNGYFSIISVQSGKALSVPSGQTQSTRVSLVQETYYGYDRQLWKITATDNGRFKIQAKSAEEMNNDLVMSAGHESNNDSNGLTIEQCQYTDDGNYIDEWYICSIIDVGMSTDDYSGSDSRERPAYACGIAMYYNMHSFMDVGPTTLTHRYNKNSTHDATKHDFITNGAISSDIDFMVYIGHGHSADRGKDSQYPNQPWGNHIQYSVSTDGWIEYTDVCSNNSYDSEEKDNFCLYTSEVNFGSAESDLRWVWMYTCKFLNENDFVTNEDLKDMMTGAHIVMGYETQSYICDLNAEKFGQYLREGNTVIQSFFRAGKEGEAEFASDNHLQKVLYIPQAEHETIYSPMIHYEYEPSDVRIVTSYIKDSDN